MWTASISYDGSLSPAGSLAKKFRVSIFMYPVSVYEEKSRIMIYYACSIYGDERNVGDAIDAAKTISQVHHLERNGNFVLILYEEPKITKSLFMHNIIHYKPIFISAKGEEVWSAASMNKQSLMDYFAILKKLRKAKLMHIRQEKIQNISIAQIHPELTARQMNAVKLAIEHGYYCVPRKTDVQSLSKKSALAFSTFQNHLRKAESKLIPFSFLRNERK